MLGSARVRTTPDGSQLTPGHSSTRRRFLNLAAIILLRQLATDAGFDLVDEEIDHGWMRVRSSHARLSSWLRVGASEGGIEAGLSRLDVPELLRASHARPWAECDNDADRLDVFNGLLLAAHLDAAFDSGLIAIAEDGAVMVSMRLSPAARATLGLAEPRRIVGLLPGHTRFLAWHRLMVWQARSSA